MYDDGMKVFSWLAISLDGYIARDNGDEEWLPEEGWDEFVEVARQHDNIVMGRETFELVMDMYPDYNFDSVDVAHKIIVTSQQDYTAPAGYTVVHSVDESIALLENSSIATLFVIGGGKLNTEFLRSGRVDELWVTVSPYILGKGRRFITDESELDIQLKLLDVSKTSLDRVQLKYKVIGRT